MGKKTIVIILLLLNAVFCLLNLLCGSVEIPISAIGNMICGNEGGFTNVQRIIILESRLPAALCAVLTGGALGACGLMLQSYFRNPLAGPSILGITSGAQLMVAIVTLTGLSTTATVFGGFQLVGAALVGALGMLMLLLWIGTLVRNSVGLLIVGILLSYLTSAILTLLNYYASADGVQSLLLWGMGSFGNISLSQLPYYAAIITAGLLLSIGLIKPLNGWMLGHLYAKNLGFNLERTRIMILLCTGLLCAVTTAWCGPISFIGLSVPHIARLWAKSDNHRYLLPLSILLGGLCCSLCLWISTWPEGGRLLPINALTPILGIPVVLWVILKGVIHKNVI